VEELAADRHRLRHLAGLLAEVNTFGGIGRKG
jgi:hypothetical protein